MRGLRLLIHDDTCRGRGPLPGLSHSWLLGARLYRALGRIDLSFGAGNWSEALDWLARVGPGREIEEIQFWGHGNWGLLRMGGEILDRQALRPGHPLHAKLRAVRERFAGPRALWWLRCCETFGARAGHRFAREWADFFGCAVAGHTFIIGLWQSGLHVLTPGEAPDWPLAEGLAEGTPDQPVRALPSRRGLPRTISFLTGRIPLSWHPPRHGPVR